MVPLTADLQASAYDNDGTRALIALARSSRLADDSALTSYDETSLERLTVRFSIGTFGRDRLLLRQERAEHVRWRRGRDALVEVTGARSVMPLFPLVGEGRDEVENEAISLPYVPGRRTLSMGGERNDDSTYTDVDDIVDPLAPGAEAYYRYAAGDSEAIRTGEQVLRLREVRLHARRPIWNLGVGSLWFDAASGHLVRAVYRFAAPMNIVAVAKDADPHTFDDVPFWIRPLIMPMTASLSAVTIEYSLLEKRFWMPVARFADGEARVSAMHVPVRWEVRYRYRSVNAPPPPPAAAERVEGGMERVESPALSSPAAGPGVSQLPSGERQAAHDKGGSKSTQFNMLSGASRTDDDSTRRHSRDAQCSRGPTWERVEVHDGGAARLLVVTPCDTAALARSSDLPGSIYEDAGTPFGSTDVTDLLKTLASSPEPDWSPQAPEWRWGPRDGLLRYNRIEGLSAGLARDQEFGLGLAAHIEGRFGVADLQPDGELRLTRTSPVGTLGVAVYRRLGVANDWPGGDPLSFGSSVWNLLVGDDEGFYYRAWGGEVTGSAIGAGGALPFAWRFFTEQEWSARVETHFSLTGVVGGAEMMRRNVDARPGAITGVSFHVRPIWGLDPDGFQGSADVSGEGAGGSYAYVRGAVDLTVSHPVTRFAEGALRVSGGTLAGDIAPQRLWYLGGLRTVRGLAPGTEAGDAYWLTHVEVGPRSVFFRPVAFYDLGWAGDRSDWGREGRALSGAGVGASFLDGLIRVDAAKGIWPTHSVRVNAYLQGAF